MGSPEIALAERWLHDCVSGTGRHAQCSQNDNVPLLPTRVIEVGLNDACTRLHISQSGEKGHYVALSHCWGGQVPIMTTTTTIDEFAEKLPAQIPKTFADAIAVTRNMGQKYLWVDSFCIIQDSTDDWIKESSRMDQVYSQALFTIVADAASDSYSGFLQPPARRVKDTKVVRYDLGADVGGGKPTSHGFVHVRERGELAFQLPYHDHYPEGSTRLNPEGSDWSHAQSLDKTGLPPRRSKLSTRAWAFQERLLSPRTLHFGPAEMAWECRALCNCECSATNERTSRVTSLLKGSIALQPYRVQEQSTHEVLLSVDNAWRRDIVEEYTRLDLTKETDRLSALAGVAARALTLRPGDQYMAGMWRNTLAACLSWYTTPDRSSSRVFQENGPPTWSWASVSGQIRHARIADIPIDSSLIRILSVQYEANALSRMGPGPRAPASLLAWGYIIPIESVWFQPAKEHTYYPCDSCVLPRVCYRVRWPPAVDLPLDCVAMMDVHRCIALADGSIILDRLADAEPESDMVMLLAALVKGQVYGLVLRRREVSSGAVPAYERMGFVNGTDVMGDLHKWGSGINSSKPMCEPPWQHDENLGISSILGGIGKTMVKIW